MLAIHLLGRPRLERLAGEAYQFRSRKSWALLAYLILSDHLPTRAQLAALLFPDADDPLRALRWSLNEIRRGLGEDGTVDGDPVTLRLPPKTTVDVELLVRGSWADAAANGEISHAFDLLADSSARSNRVSDPYVWLSVYILDAQCSLGLAHGHPSTPEWAQAMLERSARTGMREFLVRAMLHRAALGHHGDADAATVLAEKIDNPRLQTLVHAPFRPAAAEGGQP